MAGVQIPQLKRLSTPEPQTGQRMNANALVPDLNAGMDVRQKGAEKVANSTIDYLDKVEMDAADTEATKRSIEYESMFKEGMYGKDGIKYKEGDPTEYHRAFEDKMVEQFNRLAGDESLSGRTRDLVVKRMTEKANTLEMHRLQEYGAQQYKYQDDVKTAAVNLEKSNLSYATTFINTEDPDSFSAFDASIARIRDLHLRNGMKTGSVVPDENGKSMFIGDDGKAVRVNVGVATDYAIKKDLSEGVSDALENLINSDQIEAADQLRAKYAEYIEPVKRKGLTDKFAAAKIKAVAVRAADETNGMSPELIDKKLSNLTPEQRDKAYEIIDDRQRRKENMKERQSKTNYNMLATHVQDQMKKDPYVGISELEADPVYKNTIGRITDAKQRQAISDMVVRRKVSDPEAKYKIQDLMFSGKITETSPQDFALLTSRLNPNDAKKYDTQFEHANTETGAEEIRKYRLAGDELKSQLLMDGTIKKNDYGKLDPEDEIIYLEHRDAMATALDARSGQPMSPKEMRDFVKDFNVGKMKEKAFGGGGMQKKPLKFEGKQFSLEGTKPQEAPAKAPADNTKPIKGKTRYEWVDVFQKKFNRMPDLKTDELQKFINEQE